MAQTVSQHQLGAISTPANNAALVSSVIRGNFASVRSSLNDHDADSGIHFQSSVNASRPAAGTAGRKWLDTDTLRVYFDNGSTWSEIAYALTASPTFTGTAAFANLTTSGTIVATGTITGTLATAAQPNITSLGTLTGITCSGNISGTLTTASQTNITAVGTLTGLTVSGNVTLSAADSVVTFGANTTTFRDGNTKDTLTLGVGGDSTNAAIAIFGDVSDGTMRSDVVCQPPSNAARQTGFLRIGVLAEPPTGAAADGCVVLDEAAHRLYIRSDNAWKYVALT